MRCAYQAIGLAMLALFAAGSAQAAKDEFRAVLRGGEDVPPVTTDTRANALMNFSGATPSKLSLEILLLRGKRITQAHFIAAARA